MGDTCKRTLVAQMGEGERGARLDEQARQRAAFSLFFFFFVFFAPAQRATP